MKYVIIDQDGIETAILFDALFQHDRFIHMRPVSAGFVENVSGDEAIRVYGKSVSLGLESRPQDASIIVESMERKVAA